MYIPSFVHFSLLRNGNHTLHQKVGVVRPNFEGLRTPLRPSSGCALGWGVYWLSSCVCSCPSIRLSVTSRCSGLSCVWRFLRDPTFSRFPRLKRLNAGSRKQRHTHDSPGTLVFWCRKYRQNKRSHPDGGSKCRWGYVKCRCGG